MEAPGRSRAVRVLTWVGLLAVLAVVPLVAPTEYLLYLTALSGIFFIAVSGLNLIAGYVGRLSLAQAAFFGIGAYAAALLSLRLGAPFWLGLVAAALLPAAVAYPIGHISLKLRGPYFVIVTLAFAEIVRMVVQNWVELTGGPMGLPGIPAARLTVGSWSLRLTDTTFYYLIVGCAVATFHIVKRLTDSPMGRAWRAIRENEDRAVSLGINSRVYAVRAFCWGAGFAGLAGGIYAYYIGLVAPEITGFSYVITMLVMLILGGAGTVEGPLIGAVVFTVLPELLRVADHLRLPIVGAILMAAVIFFPEGLRPLLARALNFRWLPKGRTS